MVIGIAGLERSGGQFGAILKGKDGPPCLIGIEAATVNIAVIL